MKQIHYYGSSKLISRIVNLLNRKTPLPLDGDGDPSWGTNGQFLTTDGAGGTTWSSGGGGGDSVSWTQTQASGTQIASIDINGTATTVYAPTPITSDATQSAHGLMSTTDKTKLDGIASGAEVNVQSDWNEADSSSDAYIANKPTIPAAQVQSDWNEADNTKADYIKNKPTIPAAQIQSDWTQADNTQADYIKNKPTIPTVNDGTLTIQQNGTTVGTFTANQSGNTTVNLTGGGSSYSAGDGIDITSNVISLAWFAVVNGELCQVYDDGQ